MVDIDQTEIEAGGAQRGNRKCPLASGCHHRLCLTTSHIRSDVVDRSQRGRHRDWQ
jgi:hypothetical protein